MLVVLSGWATQERNICTPAPSFATCTPTPIPSLIPPPIFASVLPLYKKFTVVIIFNITILVICWAKLRLWSSFGRVCSVLLVALSVSPSQDYHEALILILGPPAVNLVWERLMAEEGALTCKPTGNELSCNFHRSKISSSYLFLRLSH